MNRESLVKLLSRHCPVIMEVGIQCGEEGVCGKWFLDTPGGRDPRSAWAEHVADVIYPRVNEHTKIEQRTFELTNLDRNVLDMIYGKDDSAIREHFEGRDDMEGPR